jgi:hypothetical protein
MRRVCTCSACCARAKWMYTCGRRLATSFSCPVVPEREGEGREGEGRAAVLMRAELLATPRSTNCTKLQAPLEWACRCVRALFFLPRLLKDLLALRDTPLDTSLAPRPPPSANRTKPLMRPADALGDAGQSPVCDKDT